MVAAPGGTWRARTLYKPFGEVRYQSGVLPTEYRAASPQRSEGGTFTGQYSHVDDFGLMYYGARWYAPALGRFVQADSIVSGAGNPSAWDRFAYTQNNPLRYTDPSGDKVDPFGNDFGTRVNSIYYMQDNWLIHTPNQAAYCPPRGVPITTVG